jgi:hypothetical protein
MPDGAPGGSPDAHEPGGGEGGTGEGEGGVLRGEQQLMMGGADARWRGSSKPRVLTHS